MMGRSAWRDIGLSVLAHLAIFAVFVVSFRFGPDLSEQAGRPDAVEAVAVDADEVDAMIERLEAAEARAIAEREAEEQAQREAEEEARREAEEQAQREAEEQARREAEEQARREAEEQARREAEAEAQAQREAEEQARREAEEQARREAEEQARREAEEQARREAEEQARREAEEQARREAEEQARREAEEQARREAEEQARREAEAQAARVAEARGTFDAAIRQRVTRAWERPPGVPDGLSAVVSVRLGPGGAVLTADVVQSSGDAAFDRSAERAVFRADPLPMPDDPVLAAPYRRGIELTFRPE
ncbi:cell envelope integrity protein TolA [Spiribacter sp. 2438]|uniref:cell envelope integrity protein TolA n=1 Tax=Spiribacter sp. 2438 TaxID=2666185 RepID=UPI0012AFA28E|nr:cell envelope integrity protein TolA [Spiribacter sp. 2438]QGM21179.1 cell envelope integrity protein TolA [Spiribacter sp. 2438]